jgi:hypothetical protein
MEPYHKNSSGFKNSCEKYRIIAGVRFIQWSHDASQFAALRAKADLQELKTRIIDGELYVEDKMQ